MVATDVNSVEALVHHIEDMLNLFRTEMGLCIFYEQSSVILCELY